MKKVLNFGLIVAASFMLSGCWSWQKMVSFGFWQSDEEARAERLELEKRRWCKTARTEIASTATT
ncbi:hypothetical protein QM027_08500 [Campylobacter concisus]